MATEVVKLLPHNLEAEQGLLGSVLLGEPEAIAAAREKVTNQDFYRPSHGSIFTAVCDLVDRQSEVDLITVQNRLRERGTLDECGGTEYLMQLIETVPTTAHVEHYANIVQDKATRRRIIEVASSIREKAYDEQTDTDSLLAFANDKLIGLGTANSDSWCDWYKVLSNCMKRIDEARERPSSIEGPKFGIGKLDTMLWGLPVGVTYIAARPSQGKTSLLTQLIRHNKHIPSIVFSIEMTAEQFAERLLVAESGVDSLSLRAGAVDDRDHQKLWDAANRLYNIRMFLHEDGLDITKLRAKAVRMSKREPVGMILVDYIGLLDAKGNEGSREREVAEMSRGLKKLSNDLKVPVVCAAQINREGDSAGKKKGEQSRPVLRNLKDSGAQEADADAVILIYNPHNEDPEDTSDIVDAELILAKHRFGPKGVAKCKWRKSTMEFHDVEVRQEPIESRLPYKSD